MGTNTCDPMEGRKRLVQVLLTRRLRQLRYRKGSRVSGVCRRIESVRRTPRCSEIGKCNSENATQYQNDSTTFTCQRPTSPV